MLQSPAGRRAARGGDACGEPGRGAQRGAHGRDRTAPPSARTHRHVKVISIPPILEERSFDAVVQALADAEGGRFLFDARPLRWVDPYGMLGLLAAAEVAGRGGERPVLQLPKAAEVLSYLGRMRFFDYAEELFEIHGAPRRSRGGD